MNLIGFIWWDDYVFYRFDNWLNSDTYCDTVNEALSRNLRKLNGFLFMNSTILSYINLKTSRGAKIILLTKEYEIEIDSDEIEIESDFSNVSNTWITKVSFVIDIKEKEIIENRNFEEIEYQFKKEKLRFFAKK